MARRTTSTPAFADPGTATEPRATRRGASSRPDAAGGTTRGRISPMTEERDDELRLVRHGETEWSRDGKHTFVTDLDLTEKGVEVACTLKERLSGMAFDIVLSSPRHRARRTAELAGFGDAHVENDLVEWDYGDYEGITTAEIRETVPAGPSGPTRRPGETAGQEAIRCVKRRLSDI